MPTVAIVGRPNVGKSRLFNRLVRRRVSIVHDQPGVTRDVLSAEVDGHLLLDTGGLGLKGNDTPAELIAASEEQVAFAIEAAQVILFVVDAREGLVALDQEIGAALRASGKEVILVANKADQGEEEADASEFFRLGLGEPLFLSAEHGYGETKLRQLIAEKLAKAAPPDSTEEAGENEAEKRLKIVFVGRPNVGKSSLGNRLLNSDRLIVSPIPGTTRDAVELDFDFRARGGKSWPFRLVDTAGIKAATKIGSPVEYFSRLRSLDSIRRADIVFMVLDAVDGVTQQDKAIAGEAIAAARPIIVVVNKWDLAREAFRRGDLHQYETEREYREKYEDALFRQLFFTPGAPLIFISAKEGFEIERLLRAARALDKRLDTKLPTARLNQALIRLSERTPPPAIGGKRFRIYYGTQISTRPFRIKVFCNQPRRLEDSYRRYLEAGLIEEFDLQGCPIHFELVGKERSDNPFAHKGRGSGE